jgi:hypothetical protein
MFRLDYKLTLELGPGFKWLLLGYQLIFRNFFFFFLNQLIKSKSEGQVIGIINEV